MATVAIPVMTSLEGSASLLLDNVANTWIGLSATATQPWHVFGLASGVVIDQVIQPGTLTIPFPAPVTLALITRFNRSFLFPTIPFSLGAGSP